MVRAVGRDVRDAAESGAEDRREPMENVPAAGRRKRAAAGAIWEKASWGVSPAPGIQSTDIGNTCCPKLVDYRLLSLLLVRLHPFHAHGENLFYGTYW